MTREISDENLMLAYVQGDYSAFEILYERVRLPLYRFIRKQVGDNESLVEEVYQETWLKLINARASYRVTAKFRTYLFQIAHNTLIDYYRKHAKVVNQSFEDNEHVDVQTNSTVAVERLDKTIDNALAKLPLEQREAFLLKELVGLNIQEVANVMSMTPEGAKSRVRYAVKRLKELLKGVWP